MRNNALKKQEVFEYVANDNAVTVASQTEARRRDIARQAEEACHLAGNINGPDLDLFEEQYGASLA